MRGRLRRLLVGAVVVGATGIAAPTIGATTAPAAPAAPPAAPAPARATTAATSYDAAGTPEHRVQRRDKCGPVLRKPSGRRWRCSFVDNFGKKELDRSRWIIQHTAKTGFKTGRTCYRDSPDNIAQRDGALVLTARKGRWINCRFGPRWLRTKFTGGMIGTKGKFSQKYGRFEVRMKFPEHQTGGVHGGFWMFPVEATYGPWPHSGEIDVAEWWSYDHTLVLPSLHFEGRDPDVDSGWDCRVEDPDVFHTYTLVWQRARMQFLIDGTACFTTTWEPDHPLRAPQPFDHRFSMILNVGVQDQGLSARTTFPAELLVDYAKAWR